MWKHIRPRKKEQILKYSTKYKQIFLNRIYKIFFFFYNNEIVFVIDTIHFFELYIFLQTKAKNKIINLII